jgi:hypothetical protein
MPSRRTFQLSAAQYRLYQNSLSTFHPSELEVDTGERRGEGILDVKDENGIESPRCGKSRRTRISHLNTFILHLTCRSEIDMGKDKEAWLL